MPNSASRLDGVVRNNRLVAPQPVRSGGVGTPTNVPGVRTEVPGPMAPFDAGALPSLQQSRSTTFPGLVRQTPHEAKIDAVAKGVTRESMLRTLTTLCKDPAFRAREAGSPQYLKAAQWCADQLAAMGVEPMGDVGVDGKRT